MQREVEVDARFALDGWRSSKRRRRGCGMISRGPRRVDAGKGAYSVEKELVN